MTQSPEAAFYGWVESGDGWIKIHNVGSTKAETEAVAERVRSFLHNGAPREAAEAMREAAAQVALSYLPPLAGTAAEIRKLPLPAPSEPTAEGQEAGWRCKGNVSTPDGPGECNWPFCGCDPAADKMLAHFQECDLELVPRTNLARMTAERDALKQYLNDTTNDKLWEKLREKDAAYTASEDELSAARASLARMTSAMEKAQDAILIMAGRKQCLDKLMSNQDVADEALAAIKDALKGTSP